MKIGIVNSAEQLLEPSHADITFIYSEVDPYNELSLNPFLYVHSKAELDEKIALIKKWPEIIEEIRNGMFHV